MIRPFHPEDADTLAWIYRDAVEGTGATAYSPEQIQAWLRYPDDMDEFRTKLSRGLTLVYEQDGLPVAFGQLEPGDHIAFLYTASAQNRRGMGTEIYQCLEAHSVSLGTRELSTEASRISLAFFRKQGFHVVEIQQVMRYGAEIERFGMNKALAG